VLDALNAMNEHHRFVRGMVSWLGFEQVAVTYRRDARHAGSTGYSLRKMARFALDALTSFSTRPLRLASYLGFGLALFSALMVIYSVVQRLLGNTVQGWTSLMVVVLVIGGLQLFVLGIIGEYLGRLFIEAKSRPLYLVREVVGSGGRGGERSEQLKRVDVHGDDDVVRQRQLPDDRTQMTAEL
jgi:dolichol-phosphate mannosyltransferase